MKSETARREIESLDYYLQNHTNDYSEESHTAMMMAIKALEQEPCEDCISRQALDKALYERFHDEDAPNNMTDVRLGAVRNFVKDFPSVTPTRKKGKWIPRKAKYDNMVPIYECSICHKDNGFEDTKYCPHCGSFMMNEGEKQ